MNFVQIAGFLGADPETRVTSNGLKVTTLRVAAKVRKNNADETIWWRVTIWGDHMKIVSYLKKGSAVIVTGNMEKPEIYQNREGNSQISMSLTATDVKFSPFGRAKDNNQTDQQANQQEEYAGFTQGKVESEDISDDDIPF